MIEITELYGGEIVCEFNPARHAYTIINKGRRYKVPSVTRITSVLDKSGPLINWAINNTLNVCRGAIYAGQEYSEVYLEQVFAAAKQASQQIKSDAAKRGTALHALLEAGLGRGELREDDSRTSDVRVWLGGAGISRICCVEQRIYSRRHRFSGTLDAVGQAKTGEFYLLDWKTSKSIYPEFRLQTAAYVYAWEEEHPDQKIEGRYIVRIGEDGSVEPHFYPRSTLRKDFQAFLGAKALFERTQQIEKEMRKERS